MKRAMMGRLAGALVLASGFGVGLGSQQAAVAAKQVTVEVCIVQRAADAALVSSDEMLFELDLRGVPNTPFALKPDDCVKVDGLDRDNEPGLRRVFPQGGWLVEAQVISESRVDPRQRRAQDDDDDGDEGGGDE